MKISIVIPSPHHHERLRVLLDSLFSQDAPRSDYEVLIVSELPEADLKLFLKNHYGKIKNWKYFWSGRVGLSAVKNTAVDRAQGDLIWFLSDTCLPKDKQLIKKILNRFDSNPEIAGLGGTLKYLRSEDSLSRSWFKLRRQRLHRACYFDREGETRLVWPEHSVFRKSLLNASLRFSENLDEDSAQIELCDQLIQRGAHLFLDPELELTHHPKILLKDFIRRSVRLAEYLVSKGGLASEYLTYLNPQPEFSSEKRVRFFHGLYIYAFTRSLLGKHGLWVLRWMLKDLKALGFLIYCQLYRLNLQEGPRLLNPKPRAYSLDLNLTAHPNCAFCVSLKSKHLGAGLPFDQQIEQAAFYRFEMLALPCSFFSEVADFDILENIIERGFIPLVRIRPEDFNPNRIKTLQALSYSGCRFEVLASQSFEDNQNLLEALREVRAEFDLSFSLSYPSSLKQISRLPQWALDRIQFLPIFESHKASLSQMRHELTEIHQSVLSEGKRILIQTPSAYEITTLSQANSSPLGLIENLSHIEDSNIKFSIVVPLEKVTDETRLLLDSFLKQTFDKRNFEILVVQAGLDSFTNQELKSWLVESSGKLNLSLVQSYTSAVSLGTLCNLGALYAKGSQLNFIEADILVPKNYLLELNEAFHKYDLIQCPEVFLSPEVLAHLRHGTEFELNSNRLKGPLNSEEFLKVKSWTSLKRYWTYARRASLSMDRNLFLKLGGFRASFFNPDFEAKDLAYRMSQAGLRFYRAPIEVYHLSKIKEVDESKLIESSLVFYKSFPNDRIALQLAPWLPGLGLPQSLFFSLKRQLFYSFGKIKHRFFGTGKSSKGTKRIEFARFGK